MTEEWKDIEGTYGQYQVSNTGKIRSNIIVSGETVHRILKSQKDNKGYHRIRVTVRQQKMSFKLHREVAKAFIPNPDNLPQVNHIDGDKDNNSVDNLEWVTNSENARHAIKSGLWDTVIAGSLRENESRKKPVVAINIKTGEERVFNSVSDCERELNTKHVSAVLTGKRKTTKGHVFKYIDIN